MLLRKPAEQKLAMIATIGGARLSMATASRVRTVRVVLFQTPIIASGQLEADAVACVTKVTGAEAIYNTIN